MQMPGPLGNLGLYKSRPTGLGSIAKPRELPGGIFALGIRDVYQFELLSSASVIK